MRKLRGLIRANASETVEQPRAALTMGAVWTIPGSELWLFFLHVTRSRFLKERVTAGRRGGPFAGVYIAGVSMRKDEPCVTINLMGRKIMSKCLTRTGLAALFTATLSAVASLSSLPAAADWDGMIIAGSERPKGQAEASGMAAADGAMVILLGETLTLVGSGQVTVTVTDPLGAVIVERTVSGGAELNIADVVSFPVHGVQLDRLGPSPPGGTAILLNRLPIDTTILVELIGAFNCGGTHECYGTQNGKITFQLTVAD